jgi:hypothetical protein
MPWTGRSRVRSISNPIESPRTRARDQNRAIRNRTRSRAHKAATLYATPPSVGAGLAEAGLLPRRALPTPRVPSPRGLRPHLQQTRHPFGSPSVGAGLAEAGLFPRRALPTPRVPSPRGLRPHLHQTRHPFGSSLRWSWPRRGRAFPASRPPHTTRALPAGSATPPPSDPPPLRLLPPLELASPRPGFSRVAPSPHHACPPRGVCDPTSNRHATLPREAPLRLSRGGG